MKPKKRTKLDLTREYVSVEASKRVRKYAAERRIPISQAYHELICTILDENGKKRSELGEAEEDIKALAERLGWGIPETVTLICRTVKTIFSDNLPLWKALKSLPELEKEISED